MKQFQSLENVNACAPDHAKHLLCTKGKKRSGEVNLDIFHALGVIHKDNKNVQVLCAAYTVGWTHVDAIRRRRVALHDTINN